jgi:hypothetical protein
LSWQGGRALRVNSYDIGDKVRCRGLFGINKTTLRADADAGATTASVRSVTGWAATDVVVLNPNEATEEKLTVSSISGTTVTFTAALVYPHGTGEEAWELVDPTTVTLRVKNQAGTITAYTYALAEVTKDALGDFYRDQSLAAGSAGRWWYRFEGTGACETGGEHEFWVRDSQFD